MRSGFTLVELLVVIGIIAALTAITVPIASRLSNGQRLMGCETNMSRIVQALKLYRLDEGGYPPHVYVPAVDEIRGRGLLTLVDTGYLRAWNYLKCPADRANYLSPAPTGPDDPGHRALITGKYTAKDPLSYMWVDPRATYAFGVLPFKYLSSRPLCPGLNPDPDADRVPWSGRPASYQPDDSTVVTWCDAHASVIRQGGRDQYLVLFYDGHFEKRDADLFRQGSVSTSPPEESWRVHPQQQAWDGSGLPVY